MPTGQPLTKEQIRKWWAARPMTYGETHGATVYKTADGRDEAVELGSREFFENADKTFYGWTEGLHNEEGYFGRLFPYAQYRGKKVLEIGCGMGAMAMNWAQHGCFLTAVDLTPMAVAQTSRRFQLFGLSGSIMEMDANALTFEDDAFDYVYSFDVLHHSPNLDKSIAEMFRVLRPGGGFALMLYNRHSIFYWYLIRYLEGFLHGESRYLETLRLASRYTDGAQEEGNPYTWPVTRKEMKHMLSKYSRDLSINAMGSIEYCFPPKIGSYFPESLKYSWSRRWGWSLWMTGTKA